MKKIILFMATLCLLTSCNFFAPKDKKEVKEAKQPSQEEIDTTNVSKVETIDLPEGYNKIIDVPIDLTEVNASIPSYKVRNDLSNIENLDQFGDFTDVQKEALVNSGFFIAPLVTDPNDTYASSIKEQLFYIYEDNEYKLIPSFITTDSVLHTYHIFYDNFLKRLEEETLYDKLFELTDNMFKDSITQYESINNEKVKDLALRNIAYFATAELCLGEKLPDNIPDKAKSLAREEYKKISSKQGEASDILGIKMDYSQFTPRGHYTKSEILKKYFITSMYYGQAGFFVKDDGNYREDLTGMALLITDNVFSNKASYNLWSDIFDPLSFLVDSADDLTVKEYSSILYGIYGKEPDLNDLLNKKKLKDVYGNIEIMRKPKIGGFLGQSFRFLPQRAVFDSVWMQNLVEIAGPNTPSRRPIYSGLDVAAVMGSDYATNLQLNNPDNKKWPDYEKNLKKTTEEVASIKDETWKKNLYRGWLWSLEELTKDFGEGYPEFMKKDSWKAKDTNTLLGSWAELKHDTVLYGKQPIAECGGGGYDTVPKSYVEPNVNLYKKLAWLIEFSAENLRARDMLDEFTYDNIMYLKTLCDDLASASIKELSGEELTEDEYINLMYIGGTLESVSLKFVTGDSPYWELLDENDRHMSITADLMSIAPNSLGLPEGEYLHAGLGDAYEIYTVFPINGKLYLGRGGVLSYREFINSERLTDEAFREILKSDPSYGITPWAADLYAGPKSKIPEPDVMY
ncbi:DUF3160 domain-containing protein [Peptoniphilus catoniae]|uniref:DUF3160 domain-containing protein n=1 Tax=Peptoniphilus catoniae TaxID=1660341 RepID=UPI0010FDCD0E|nr:DUF3160 domain-containing protein [Peptoniphilus catoniae]